MMRSGFKHSDSKLHDFSTGSQSWEKWWGVSWQMALNAELRINSVLCWVGSFIRLSCGNSQIWLFWKLWAWNRGGKTWRPVWSIFSYDWIWYWCCLESHFFVPISKVDIVVPKVQLLFFHALLVGWIGWRRAKKVKSVAKGELTISRCNIRTHLRATFLSYPWIVQ